MTNLQRPTIPPKIKIKLWTAAAGRCEFAGCNIQLWSDDLTIKKMNRSNIAHIISWTPTGPRGSISNSKKLSKDFKNLMLVCLTHGKLIDNKEYVNEYSIEKLTTFKKNHEARIFMQTSMQENYKTTILRFIANIANRNVSIPIQQIQSAIDPKYPADEKGIDINFLSMDGDGDKHYWKTLAKRIKDKIHTELLTGTDEKAIKHLSIFALGPIPLLVQLGASIGNLIPSDLYQHHRDTDRWNWKDEDKNWKGYEVKKKKLNKNNNNIAVILSLSGKIHEEEVLETLDVGSIYEITIKKPLPTFLNTKKALYDFQKEYRKLLTEIRQEHGINCQINLFPAIPAPIAILCGQVLLPKIDPPILIYDNNKAKGGFKYCLTII